MGYKFLFPFDEVEKNSKIIIYGGGQVGHQFLHQIIKSNYCHCLFIVDKNFENMNQIYGVDVLSPEQIKACIYDKIVIASTAYNDEIHNLLSSWGIPDDKIIKKVVSASAYSVVINDYKYTPKCRESLKFSEIGKIIDKWYDDNKKEVIDLIQYFYSFKHYFEKIPLIKTSPNKPNWTTRWIRTFDAISIYGFLALKNPRYYVEVGSGNTTLFAAQSIHDNNLRTKIISIDPFPREDIDEICDKIYRIPFENMDMKFFDMLTADDIFLLDCSHRSFPNSDVTVFFTEVLPRLPMGLLYTIHDIYLPYDYPERWSVNEKRWYNEQYLLCTYLLGGAGGDKIKCPNHFLSYKQDIYEMSNSLYGKGKLFEGDIEGLLFWMEKS